jgi:hypothetical protein
MMRPSTEHHDVVAAVDERAGTAVKVSIATSSRANTPSPGQM